MLKLNRLTSEYIESEDRFRLTGEDQNGNALCLWLTQRLALRIISYLVADISTRSAEAAQNPSQDGDTANLLQGMAQQAAQADFSPHPAVDGENVISSLLVQEVDINRSQQGHVGLVFKDPSADDVVIGFEPQQLRQWLAIIHTQWLKAEWPAAVWPDWIGSKEAPQGSDSLSDSVEAFH